MHSLIIRWAFKRAKESELIKKETTIRSLAMIDDMIARIDGIRKDPEEIARVIAKSYADLGYEIDIVKSLASNSKAIFLNKVYDKGLEVLTSSKVFSKIDREWDRMFVDCWSMADSIIGSAQSASDRGANPMLCYKTAMTLIVE